MGTAKAPIDQIAKSRTVHSYRVGDRIATGFPASTPRETNPLAAART